jgi:hypothetical protein
VLGDQFPLDKFVELVQVNVTENRRYHTALRASAERVVILPVLQVPGFQHVPDKPQEPLVVNLLRQYPEQDIVIQAAEAVGDVALNKPGYPGPGFAYLPQCGMTPSPFPEAVRPVREDRLVIRLQEETDHFADQFIGPRRHTERAEFPVFLRDPDAARR